MLHLLVMLLVVAFLILHPIKTLLAITVFVLFVVKFDEWVSRKR